MVGLSACTETNLAPDQLRKDRQIRFITAPVKTTGTRADYVTTTDFDKSQTFGTAAFQLADSKNWKDNAADATVISDINGKTVSYDNTAKVWKISNESYFWDDYEGYKLNFLSWSPASLCSGYTAGSASTATGLTITDAHDFSYTGWTMSATPGYGYTKDATTGEYSRNTTDGSIDLLLAKSTDCTEDNSASGVLTRFVHQLCNVRVFATIMDDPGSTKWEITKVELSDIYTKGNLLKAATVNDSSTATAEDPLYNTQIWGGHSDAATYTYTPAEAIELKYTTPTATEVEIFPKTLMLPQSVLTVQSTSSSSTTRSPKITVTCKCTETDSSGSETTSTKTLYGVLASNRTTDLTTWLAGQSIIYHIYISTVDYWIDFDASSSTWDNGDAPADIIIGN